MRILTESFFDRIIKRMPIECGAEIESVGQDEFHRIDTILMRHAFDIHNSMGRFFDERIYQDELAGRCRMAGLESRREVEIRLIHGSFSKSYFIDMLIERSAIYELKACESLAASHQNQLINYLLLTDTNHGKLLNLRTSSVQSRFVSTTMTRHDRMSYRLITDGEEIDDTMCINLKNLLLSLVDDWGICLDLNAYREALLHFTTGPTSGLLPVPIISHDRIVGSQRMCLLNSESAWHLSSLKSNHTSHEKHIRRLLSHTGLSCIYWINFNQKDIHFRTIKNDSVIK